MDRETLASKASAVSSYDLLFQALSLIPISHYLLAAFFVFLTFLYNFLEIHFLHDLFTLFRGDPIKLTHNSCSDLCQSVVAKCKILHGRYLVTPWLSSPHLQTAFLSLFGRAPPVTYRRDLFRALDWLTFSDGDKTPIVIVIPGLTSDSASAYVKHLAFHMARQSWNVVVSNHHGLGGVSLMSDCCYNAGWTEDIRKIINYIHYEYPEAPLYAVGTSIGANILVKYLGEDGTNTPLVGAATICSPWDLLICDRFVNRRPVQKIYDRVLTVGLQGYAQLHQSILSRLADWEGIKKSSSFRDLDNYATRVLGKFEVKGYYLVSFPFYLLLITHLASRLWIHIIGVQAVQLCRKCVSTLDDPACTSEAIPWDECRANENIILATTHGGHLAFYEGLTASSLWWVRAVDEFFGVIRTSPFIKTRQKLSSLNYLLTERQSRNVDILLPSFLLPCQPLFSVGNEPTDTSLNDTSNEHRIQSKKDEEAILDKGTSLNSTEKLHSETHILQQAEQNVKDLNVPVQGRIDKLSRRSRQSIWLLAYIALLATWPFVGSVLLSVLKRRLKTNVMVTLFRK
ncbi:hypothetical protein PTKIN_Ptkin02bG0253700 [Pterospermum kingtungense]